MLDRATPPTSTPPRATPTRSTSYLSGFSSGGTAARPASAGRSSPPSRYRTAEEGRRPLWGVQKNITEGRRTHARTHTRVHTRAHTRTLCGAVCRTVAAHAARTLAVSFVPAASDRCDEAVQETHHVLRRTQSRGVLLKHRVHACANTHVRLYPMVRAH